MIPVKRWKVAREGEISVEIPYLANPIPGSFINPLREVKRYFADIRVERIPRGP